MSMTNHQYDSYNMTHINFREFSKAMMNLIEEQTELDVENDFRKFKPWITTKLNDSGDFPIYDS